MKEFKTFQIATTVVDAIASNYAIHPIDHGAATLFSLQKLLASFRGGNDTLLRVLETRMRTAFEFVTLDQNLDLDYPAIAELPKNAQGNGIVEGILSQEIGAFLTTSMSTSQTEEEFPWVNTELTTFGRPSSVHGFLDMVAAEAVGGLSMPASEA